MAQEYIVLEPKNELGNVRLNRSVFSSIVYNVVDEFEDVQLAEEKKRFKSNILATIEENKLYITVPVRISHKANVSDVCAKLQDTIFESISYMTEFKPESIEIQVTGFIF